MKQLFFNGKATKLFFNNNVSIQQITDWINDEGMNYYISWFRLNERHSCKAEYIEEDNTILITGDEDRAEVTIDEVIPINI